jgi:predicted outer membrane repeat protein
MKPVFKGCLFEDNQATTQGGAIYTHGHSYTTLELRNCAISGNGRP